MCLLLQATLSYINASVKPRRGRRKVAKMRGRMIRGRSLRLSIWSVKVVAVKYDFAYGAHVL